MQPWPRLGSSNASAFFTFRLPSRRSLIPGSWESRSRFNLDTVWDAIHTFIRPPAAALLAYAAAGGAAPEWRWGAALIAGGVALASHGTKASARAAVNATPEPFSNWILSFGEDVLAVWLAWMAAAHPLATIIVVAALVVLSIFLLYHLFRFARRALQRLLAV